MKKQTKFKVTRNIIGITFVIFFIYSLRQIYLDKHILSQDDWVNIKIDSYTIVRALNKELANKQLNSYSEFFINHQIHTLPELWMTLQGRGDIGYSLNNKFLQEGALISASDECFVFQLTGPNIDYYPNWLSLLGRMSPTKSGSCTDTDVCKIYFTEQGLLRSKDEYRCSEK